MFWYTIFRTASAKMAMVILWEAFSERGFGHAHSSLDLYIHLPRPKDQPDLRFWTLESTSILRGSRATATLDHVYITGASEVIPLSVLATYILSLEATQSLGRMKLAQRLFPPVSYV